MKSSEQRTLWVVLLAVVFIAMVILYDRWRWAYKRRRSGWRYRKEVLEDLGEVTAVYQGKEVLWYELKRLGVNIEIGCEDATTKDSGFKFARSVTKEEIERHLNEAIQSVPESESKTWGWEKDKWRLEKVAVIGAGALSLELTNSNNRQYSALVVMENGKYEYQAAEG